MGKFFKSKFFLILLVITMVLIIIPSTLSLMGLSSYVRNAVGILLTPIQKAVSYVSDSIAGFNAYFTEFDNLTEENLELKKELKNMHDSVYDAKRLKEENDFLYTFLELKKERTDFILESAEIVGREAGNYMTVFTLNRGTFHGVAANMPVIIADGVVGYVSEVGLTWCKAISILETASSVGAYVERTREIGLIEGTFSLKDTGMCKLVYLPPNAEIEIGDRIMTSGLGSVYPRGLVIGEVAEIVPDKYSKSIYAKIKPNADLKNLHDVMIIKDYEKYIE